ncbi:MAG: hypothetical protein HY600_02275 [Candidatus Omnitrophica bacterium]|nr:hypothetical protein [Candidatus Omnitrophota bacterium]
MVHQPPHPHLNAIVLCDHVHLDTATGKYTILGTFDSIGTRQFPATHPVAMLFVNFSDAQGAYHPRFELIYLDEDVVIGSHTPANPMVVGDRLGSCNITAVLEGMVFEKPGRYAIQVYVNDKFLGDKPFSVIQVSQGGAR